MISNYSESRLTERQARLVSYWKSKSVDGCWPARGDINPGEVLSTLATVSLVELTGEDFRFRLTGSRIRTIFGHDPQGQLIAEIDETVEEAGSASMAVALESGRPVSGSRKLGHRWHLWLRLPLLDERGAPRLVLCADEICDADPDGDTLPVFVRHTLTSDQQAAA